jgi:uncharacterized 2Fe-2S/4Fe-4S cluster protein (DUF4445 family)
MLVMVRIKVIPSDVELEVERGEIIGEALSEKLGFPLPCGGAGFCGGCAVRIIEGEVSEPRIEEALSGALERGMRLACMTRVLSDVVVEIPEIVPTASVSGIMPKLELDTSHLPNARGLGLAVDLGTTNIVGSLIELSSGKVIAESFVRNPQIAKGSDLITRIERAMRGEDMGPLAVEGIESLISKLTGDRERICSLIIVANSVMQALLLGLDIRSLSSAPFDPPLKDWLIVPALEIGIELPEAIAIIPPAIGGFAGSDALADVVTTRLLGIGIPYLLIDLGTNSEVVLDTGDSVLVATAPAGSAFEMNAGGVGGIEEAVSEVRFEDGRWKLKYSRRPLGLTGSGLISAVAEMLRIGFIDESGRMRREFEGSISLSDDPKIEITQRDIREVQKGVSAIYSAWRILIDEASIEPERVVIAGTFGSNLKYEDALRIGLIPPVPESDFISIGNSSLTGAKSIMMSRRAYELAKGILRIARHIDLTGKQNFPDIFIEGLMLRERRLRY